MVLDFRGRGGSEVSGLTDLYEQPGPLLPLGDEAFQTKIDIDRDGPAVLVLLAEVPMGRQRRNEGTSDASRGGDIPEGGECHSVRMGTVEQALVDAIRGERYETHTRMSAASTPSPWSVVRQFKGDSGEQ